MFEALKAKAQKQLHEFGFELSRAHDPYRLAHLLQSFSETMDKLDAEANRMVHELEELDEPVHEFGDDCLCKGCNGE
jgi:hypothetical protein